MTDHPMRPARKSPPISSDTDELCCPPLKFHPLAELFPPIEGEEFQHLVADIKARGLLHPITTHDGLILDGRNRYRACSAAGVPFRSETYTGDDPAGFVISSNLHRRHLNESQRAMVAAKLANLGHGQRKADSSIDLSQADAADRLKVGTASVKRAVVVRDRGTSALNVAVEQGQIAVSVAAKLADLPAEVQLVAVANPERAKHLVKRHGRAERERVLAEKTIAASQTLGTKLYGVIYADPPWRFEPRSRDTGMDRAAENHYRTEPTEKIKALPVGAAAALDCVLFMWAIVPMLPQALDVMAAWGFEYRSALFWDKVQAGTGYWTRGQIEVLLIGTRGNVPAPAPGEQPEQIIRTPRVDHSVKPEVFAQVIGRLYPNLPKLEMFARRRREGWDSWGNEV